MEPLRYADTPAVNIGKSEFAVLVRCPVRLFQKAQDRHAAALKLHLEHLGFRGEDIKIVQPLLVLEFLNLRESRDEFF